MIYVHVCLFMLIILPQIYTEIETSKSNVNIKESILSSLLWNQLQGLFLVMVQFSQRNSPIVLPNEREKLWLPLLQLLISAHNRFQGVEDLSAAFNDMNKHLLSSMMGHVSLPTIVEVVMNNPSYQTATFAEIRDLVTGSSKFQLKNRIFIVSGMTHTLLSSEFSNFQECWKLAHMKT